MQGAGALAQTGLRLPRSQNFDINHAFVSQITPTELLQETGWPNELEEMVADAVGCHHVSRATINTLDILRGDKRALGFDDWAIARRGILEPMVEVFKPSRVPTKQTLSGPDFMLFSGLTSFADWIGSNEAWFSFGTPGDCEDLQGWFQKRRTRAD